MFVPRYDIGEFLSRDPARIDVRQANDDLHPLGISLLKVVGFHQDETGDWVGQEEVDRAPVREGIELHFEPDPESGWATIVEFFAGTDRFAGKAFLPINEQNVLRWNGIYTSTDGDMECLDIPVPPETDAEALTRAYVTAQQLVQDVLTHYEVTL